MGVRGHEVQLVQSAPDEVPHEVDGGLGVGGSGEGLVEVGEHGRVGA